MEDPHTATENIVGAATLAEDRGFDSVWAGDHVVVAQSEVNRFGTVWFEALTTLTFVAARTSRVSLGTSVLVAPYRHPLLVAKMLASLDVLSGGRVDAGFGTGWLEPEFRALGLDDFSARGAVTDETLAVVRAAWDGSLQLPGEGDDALHFEPRPLQTSSPAGIPVWIGGNSRRAARRVVEYGDAWMLVRVSTDEFAQAKKMLGELSEQLGRDPATISLAVEQPLSLLAGGDPDGTPFIGSRDQVHEQLATFQELGCDEILLDLHHDHGSSRMRDTSIERVYESIEIFAAEFLPGLHR